MKAGLGLPNPGCDGVDAAGELKAKALLDPNIMDVVLVVVLEAEDAPKANPVEEDAEVNAGTNIEDLDVGQLELNAVDIELVVELIELASEEVEEASPKVAPELNVEELNKEPPEEKALFAVNPKGDDPDDPD